VICRQLDDAVFGQCESGRFRGVLESVVERLWGSDAQGVTRSPHRWSSTRVFWLSHTRMLADSETSARAARRTKLRKSRKITEWGWHDLSPPHTDRTWEPHNAGHIKCPVGHLKCPVAGSCHVSATGVCETGPASSRSCSSEDGSTILMREVAPEAVAAVAATVSVQLIRRVAVLQPAVAPSGRPHPFSQVNGVASGVSCCYGFACSKAVAAIRDRNFTHLTHVDDWPNIPRPTACLPGLAP
jgi:hypothetical protein